MANNVGQLINSTEAGKYTLGQLTSFINESGMNMISYCCNRNPTVVYGYTVQNYPYFPKVGNGLRGTPQNITNMYNFLLQQYNALPAAQQAHWLATLGHSLPNDAELINWTTPA